MSIYPAKGYSNKEFSTLPASIAAVETAIPVFIGHTKEAAKDGVSVRGVATRITSMLEYESIFGYPYPENITIEIEDTYTGEDSQPARIISRHIKANPPEIISPFKMWYSLRLFFDNGGVQCYIISVDDFNTSPTVGNSTTPNSLLGGLAVLEKADEPTLIVFPDDFTLENGKVVYESALAQCEKLRDRFVILDVKANTSNPIADTENFRNIGIGASDLKYGAAYYPNLISALNFGYDPTLVTIRHIHSYTGKGKPSQHIVNAADGTNLSDLSTSDPNLHRAVIAEINKLFVTVPPSGAIAGVYARVDSQRGVWKAPANVDLRSVLGPAIEISQEQQSVLNVDALYGKSINAIRSFTGKGTLVWGARTLSGNDNEWRYVSVLRFFIMVEESVNKAIRPFVFEPNDTNTWVKVRFLIENFLTLQWRSGALAGAKPGEAFFVSVGLGQTMTAEDILKGYVHVEVGMAVLRPAEFIILKLSYKVQEAKLFA